MAFPCRVRVFLVFEWSREGSIYGSLVERTDGRSWYAVAKETEPLI